MERQMCTEKHIANLLAQIFHPKNTISDEILDLLECVFHEGYYSGYEDGQRYYEDERRDNTTSFKDPDIAWDISEMLEMLNNHRGNV